MRSEKNGEEKFHSMSQFEENREPLHRRRDAHTRAIYVGAEDATSPKQKYEAGETRSLRSVYLGVPGPVASRG